MIGKTLGHYRVVARIGAGGMGEVYRAHDEHLDRDVALKVLPAGTLANEAARMQFRREALALSKLNHPNIATVYDFDTQDGIDFLAMELIPGQALSAKLAQGPVSEGEVRRLGGQLAEGLAAAHAQGVVHRDLKPGNLMITPEGRLKILDFGLARLFHPEDPGATLTETQAMSGTLPYMSPEQVRGETADARSDIYAAGAVVYEMAAGRRAFPQTQHGTLIDAILHESPMQPSRLNQRITPGLEAVIVKALDKEPTRRYQSARELLVALEGSGAGQTMPVARAQWPMVAAGSAALMLILLAGLLVGLNVGGFRDRLHRASAGNEAAGAPSTPVKARRSVAVLGFKNVSGRQDEAWLSTALSEMLTTELAAGEQLRTVPGENVAQMKSNLSLPDADSFGKQTLSKIRQNLDSDDVVLGTYVPLGEGQIRLDLRLQDTLAGETLAAISEKGTEAQLDDLVARAGTALREKLGAGEVSSAEAAAVKASLPSNPEATRLYSEGLVKLRVFDALAARQLFERAVAAAPGYPLAHSALASAWATLGYDEKAQLEAKKAFELSTNLPREQRLWVEGRYRETTHEWAKAIEVYKSLRNFFPDNLDYGLRLVAAQTAASSGKDALATIGELRKLPPPARDDPRIDLAEAHAAMTLGDFKRALETAKLAATKGDAQGARLLVAHAQLSKGSALQELGKTKEAIQAAEEAKRLFAAAGDEAGVAAALLNLGNLHYTTGDVAGARRSLQESLSIYQKIGNGAGIEKALTADAAVRQQTGDLEGAKLLFEQALEISRKIGDARGAALTTNNLAGLLYQKGDLEAAKHMEENTLDVYRRIGDKSKTAGALSNLGMILREQGNLPDSRTRYEEALATYREIGQADGVAAVTNSLASILHMQSNFLAAKAMYEQSLAAFSEIGDKGGMLRAQNNLGGVLRALGDLPGARKLYEQSLALARESEDKSAVAQVLGNIGDLLEAQADLAGARRTFEEALAARKAIGEKSGIVDSRLSLANLSIEDGNPAAAEQPAQEAAEEFRKEKSSFAEAAALAVLARALLEQGKTHAAEKTMATAMGLAEKSGESEYRTPVVIEAARIDAASGKTAAAEKSLQSVLAEAGKLGDVPSQLEASLALGEVEMKSGKTTAGQARLAALEKDAAAKGFLLIARKAAAASR